MSSLGLVDVGLVLKGLKRSKRRGRRRNEKGRRNRSNRRNIGCDLFKAMFGGSVRL